MLVAVKNWYLEPRGRIRVTQPIQAISAVLSGVQGVSEVWQVSLQHSTQPGRTTATHVGIGVTRGHPGDLRSSNTPPDPNQDLCSSGQAVVPRLCRVAHFPEGQPTCSGTGSSRAGDQAQEHSPQIQAAVVTTVALPQLRTEVAARRLTKPGHLGAALAWLGPRALEGQSQGSHFTP